MLVGGLGLYGIKSCPCSSVMCGVVLTAKSRIIAGEHCGVKAIVLLAGA